MRELVAPRSCPLFGGFRSQIPEHARRLVIRHAVQAPVAAHGTCPGHGQPGRKYALQSLVGRRVGAFNPSLALLPSIAQPPILGLERDLLRQIESRRDTQWGAIGVCGQSPSRVLVSAHVR